MSKADVPKHVPITCENGPQRNRACLEPASTPASKPSPRTWPSTRPSPKCRSADDLAPDLRSFKGHRYPVAPRSLLAQSRLTRALREHRLDRPSARRSRPICLASPPCGLATPLYQSDVKSKAAVGVRTSTSTSVAPRRVRSDTDLCRIVLDDIDAVEDSSHDRVVQRKSGSRNLKTFDPAFLDDPGTTLYILSTAQGSVAR